MIELQPTEKGYTNQNGELYRIVGGRLGGLGDPITLAVTGAVTLIKLISNSQRKLAALKDQNTQLQYVLETLQDQNAMLDEQILKVRKTIRQYGETPFGGVGLGDLGKWFCLFNCNKKIEQSGIDYRTAKIQDLETEQAKKVDLLQRLTAKLQGLQAQEQTLQAQEATSKKVTQTASIVGWGTGLIALSLIGGHFYQKWKEKKGKKPTKKKTKH